MSGQFIGAEFIECWKLGDRYHREDGPAIVMTNGTRMWYDHGRLHRTDGPAVMLAGGMNSWYIYHQRITDWQSFQHFTNCTNEELSLLILKYGDIK